MPPRRAPKAATKPKQIFKKKVFALTGDFNIGDENNKTHENIERWITAHGGTVQSEVNDNVDILVSSLVHYNKKFTAVKEAIRLQKLIVTYDWIEDCLLAVEGPELIADKKYRLLAVESRIVKAKKEAVRAKEEYKKEFMENRDLVNTMKWRVYWDDSAFKMEIILTRVDPTDLKKNEKCILYLYETTGPVPKDYTFATRFYKGGRLAGMYKPFPDGTKFFEAFAAFKSFFQKMTGIEWDQRCDELKPIDHKFRYIPPGGGKPVGHLPIFWISPEMKRQKAAEVAARAADRSERARMLNNQRVNRKDKAQWVKDKAQWVKDEDAKEAAVIEEERKSHDLWLSSYPPEVLEISNKHMVINCRRRLHESHRRFHEAVNKHAAFMEDLVNSRRQEKEELEAEILEDEKKADDAVDAWMDSHPQGLLETANEDADLLEALINFNSSGQ